MLCKNKSSLKDSRLNFKSILFGSFFLFIILLLALIFLILFHDENKAKEKYFAVKTSSKVKKGTEQENTLSHQSITDFRKDFLYSKNGQRYQFSLWGQESLVTFDQKNSETVIQEDMKNITCFLQEALYYVLPDGRRVIRQQGGLGLIEDADPSEPESWISFEGLAPKQDVLFIQADHATYKYDLEDFFADNVSFKRIQLEGHTLPLPRDRELLILMKGTAKSLRISLKDDQQFLTNVIIESPFGMLSANSVMLHSSSMGIIELNNHVEIKFIDGGGISCQCAKIDFHNSCGYFLSNSESERVIYREELMVKEGLEVPLVLQGSQISVLWAPSNNPAKEIITKRLTSITAEGDVEVIYDKEFSAFCDLAEYHKNPSPSLLKKKNQFLGLITLKTTQEDKLCRLINYDGMISGKEVRIDTAKRNLVFIDSHGKMNAEGRELEFAADHLYWEENLQVLSLSGNVHVSENGFDDLHRSLGDISKNDYNSQARNRVGMYADEMQIGYKKEGEKITADSVNLYGNVRVVHLISGLGENANMQYVLADRVSYFPGANKMQLGSMDASRVLFFDKVNDMQMSAPELTLSEDPLSHKQKIEGIGDVRFNFIEKEFDQLRTKFGNFMLSIPKG